MTQRVLNKHKAGSIIHIEWSHDNPMRPFSSSPQWLCGDIPTMDGEWRSSHIVSVKTNSHKAIVVMRRMGALDCLHDSTSWCMFFGKYGSLCYYLLFFFGNSPLWIGVLIVAQCLDILPDMTMHMWVGGTSNQLFIRGS